MNSIIDPAIKKRRLTLCMVFITVILCEHLMGILLLLLYTLEEVNVPPISKIFYTTFQPIDLYIEKSAVLSYLKHSEIVKSTILLLNASSLLIVPLAFYKKAAIKGHISRMKTAGAVNTRGKLLIALTILFMLLFLIIAGSVSLTPQILPPLDLKNIIPRIRYVFIACLFGPFVEELLLRGIFFDEIRRCYTLTPRLAIFYQALLFYGLHIILVGAYSLVTFLMGLAAGIFCFYTNSLLYGLILHVCWNTFALLLQTGIINITGLKKYNFMYPLVILSIGVVIVCLYLFTRYMKKTRTKKAKRRKATSRQA
ncbi:MAG: CPBP family intramembrane metalloprotease [Treponema sp.]|nr:CPBP family intramembrane metalloprotease [Treponema sp.]